MNTDLLRKALPLILIALLLASCGKEKGLAEKTKPTLSSEFKELPTEAPKTLPNALTIKPESLLNKGGAKVMAASTLSSGHQAGEESKSILPDAMQGTTYIINGIGTSGTNRMAIINSEVLKPGTEIAPGITLQEVCNTYAVLNVGGKLHLIRPEDIQSKLEEKIDYRTSK